MLLFYPWIERKLLNYFSHVVVQAEFLANILRERHPSINCDYIVLTTDCVFNWHPEMVNLIHKDKIKSLKESGKFIVGIIARSDCLGPKVLKGRIMLTGKLKL